MSASYVSLPLELRPALQSVSGRTRALMHTQRLMVSSALAWLTCGPICMRLEKGGQVRWSRHAVQTNCQARIHRFVDVQCIVWFARSHGVGMMSWAAAQYEAAQYTAAADAGRRREAAEGSDTDTDRCVEPTCLRLETTVHVLWC